MAANGTPPGSKTLPVRLGLLTVNWNTPELSAGIAVAGLVEGSVIVIEDPETTSVYSLGAKDPTHGLTLIR